ncbi:hypothetical protein [Actinomadura algeriensis]|uniref:Uncharacterized protein n=1 Tax=Actinomadura algeriensis TaxID=1679523 RepID=A0ABR9JV67_9ACTN|nr:hypothetical protein [Actinomadura algeriensis]MBE1534000.1 hypothetical protein [Actinomadura algeriensis]
MRASNEPTGRWARHAGTGGTNALSGAALLAAAADGPGRAEPRKAVGCDAGVADRGDRARHRHPLALADTPGGPLTVLDVEGVDDVDALR